MSISLSRIDDHDLERDPLGNLRVVFKIQVDDGLAQTELKNMLSKVGEFLSEFEAKTGLLQQETFNGFAYTIDLKEGLGQKAFTSIADIDSISVRSEYAQDFEADFNAEFN